MKMMIGTCCALVLGVTFGSPPLVDRAGAQAKSENAQAPQGAQSASKQDEGEQKPKQGAAKPAANTSETKSSDRDKSNDVVWSYTYYGLDYDDDYVNDWFYDYYLYDDGPYAAYYPDYTYDYDWDADLFDWEEDGLFR